MKIRKMKSNLDERQELKLLKIEHNGCWIAFWGLLIVMAIQMIVGCKWLSFRSYQCLRILSVINGKEKYLQSVSSIPYVLFR